PQRHKGRSQGSLRPHSGGRQVAISSANTRPRSLAQLQEGGPGGAASLSTPCWRGVGMIASRSVLCGAKHPAERTRWTRDRGTSAASFSKSSKGESLMPVVPSDHGLVKVYTRSPWASSARRSSATAPRAVYRSATSEKVQRQEARGSQKPYAAGFRHYFRQSWSYRALKIPVWAGYRRMWHRMTASLYLGLIRWNVDFRDQLDQQATNGIS